LDTQLDGWPPVRATFNAAARPGGRPVNKETEEQSDILSFLFLQLGVQ